MHITIESFNSCLAAGFSTKHLLLNKPLAASNFLRAFWDSLYGCVLQLSLLTHFYRRFNCSTLFFSWDNLLRPLRLLRTVG